MRRTLILSWIVVMGPALLAGCPDRTLTRVVPEQVKEDGPKVPVEINRNVDILFVIDNSLSMEEEQDELADNFPRFIEVLEGIEGGLPNVHIGVVSTDVGAGQIVPGAGCTQIGDDGGLQAVARGSCQAPGDRFIEDIADPDDPDVRIRNYDPAVASLEDTFSCIARLGTLGCGFEAPLESMYRALKDEKGLNTGFLRDDAFLAVVFITDEDDCSFANSKMFDDPRGTLDDPLGPLSSFRCFEFGVQCSQVADPRAPGTRRNCQPRKEAPSQDGEPPFMRDVDFYVDFLKNELGKNPADIIVAGIIGDAEPVTVEFIAGDVNDPRDRVELAPSCTVEGTGGGPPRTAAAPAVRLEYFLDQFPQRHTSTTICNDDLSSALTLIANLLAEVIGNACMKGDIDTDKETPGIQEECTVSDVQNPDTIFQQETLIRKCTTGPPGPEEALPCWYLEDDPVACIAPAYPSGKSLVVERDDGVEVPRGTFVVARCVVQ